MTERGFGDIDAIDDIDAGFNESVFMRHLRWQGDVQARQRAWHPG